MGKRQIVVVEDREPISSALRTLFTLKGWDVSVAGTLDEGLSLLAPPPDCLLLDLKLPDGNGEEILRKVRMDQLRTKVIITTALFGRDQLGQVMDLGRRLFSRRRSTPKCCGGFARSK